MGRILKIVFSLLSVLKFRIIFNRKFICAWHQEWNHLQISISDRGTISIKKRLKTNGPAYLNAAGGSISLGNYVFLNHNVSITSLNQIVIGNNVTIANNTVIVDHNHNYEQIKDGYSTQPIYIEDNVWIGANCVILPGVHIGKGAVIGAGSVVTHDVSPNTIVVGIPAKKLKNIVRN